MKKLTLLFAGLTILMLNVMAQIAVPPGFPNGSNTGVIGAGLQYSDLKASGGMSITTSGAVIQNLDINGGVTVKADNVTIRRCRIRAGGGKGTQTIKAIDQKNLLMEDCEIINGKGSDGMYGKGIWANNFTLRRVNIHTAQDGIASSSNATVEDSYIHGLVKFIDASGGWSHNDGFQCEAGGGHTLRHNTIQGPYKKATSAIRFVSGRGQISNCVAENNFLSGGAYTVYAYNKDGQPAPSNVRLINNVFEKGSWAFGVLRLSSSITLSCNRYHTGELISQNNSSCSSTSVVAAPAISPNGGTFSDQVTVSMSCATSGATIHYTTDGSAPTASSPVYSGSFVLTASKTVRAMGAKSGMSSSPVSSAAFVINTGGTGDQYTIEAEKMTLNGYTIDTGSKLNSTAIKLSTLTSPGTAASAFTGTDGTYSLTLWAVPENDGAPVVKVYVNGTQVMSETYPVDATFYTYAYREKFLATNVTINKGDQIKIEGTGDGEAYARVDKIELVKTGATDITVHTMTPANIPVHWVPSAVTSIDGRMISGQPGMAGLYIYRYENNGNTYLVKKMVVK